MVVRPLFRGDDDGSIPISPLQLYVYSCALDTAIFLNEEWHSVFPKCSKSNMQRSGRLMCFAAEFANRYYASAIWSRPVAANRLLGGAFIMELRRLAIGPGAPKNTASRMLRVMISEIKKAHPDVEKLISYQDTDAHTGTIYKASGWVVAGVSSCADWTNRKRRAKPQSAVVKVRWERTLAQTCRTQVGFASAEAAPVEQMLINLDAK